MKTLILSVPAFFILLSLVGFYTSLRPIKIKSSITPKDLGLNFEQITLLTSDGLKLDGWFIPSESESAKTLILLHGYPADKGDILPSLAFLNSKFHLLLFDFRYLGKSEGKMSTAGAKEVEDLTSALEYLKSRGIHEAGVWGFSMGAAVALMIAPSSPEIKAIVAESSYANLDLLAVELYRLPILKYPLAYLTGIYSQLFLGINLKEISPAESASRITAPLMIIHSKADQVIPFEHAQLIQKTLEDNPQVEFWFPDGLSHGEFGEEHQNRILQFFEKNL